MSKRELYETRLGHRAAAHACYSPRCSRHRYGALKMAGIDLKSSDDGLKLFRAADLDGASRRRAIPAQFWRNSLTPAYQFR